MSGHAGFGQRYACQILAMNYTYWPANIVVWSDSLNLSTIRRLLGVNTILKALLTQY